MSTGLKFEMDDQKTDHADILLAIPKEYTLFPGL
jgi:hypothetical protein